MLTAESAKKLMSENIRPGMMETFRKQISSLIAAQALEGENGCSISTAVEGATKSELRALTEELREVGYKVMPNPEYIKWADES